jgi:predicted MFS family arabinose efflux permease
MTARPVLILCMAEGLTLIGVFAFPALLPDFQAEWSLSNAQAGWIAGVYFLGYALAVPALSSLTDRIDARLVFLSGAAVCALAAGGFALFAQGLWTAMIFRFLGGVGLAGVYMPGLKALVDRVKGPAQTRAMSYYTASFSLGTMLSFLLVGEMARHFGWQAAFAFAGFAALAGFGLAASLAPVHPERQGEPGHLLDFRPVFRNRQAMGFILGYVCHMWELFTFRAWMVAFLAFAQSRAGNPAGWSPTAVATLCSGVAMAASLTGADLALRFDRRLLCVCAMLASGGMALVLGGCLALPYGVAVAAAVIYTALVQLDSAALTTGAMLSAEPTRRGATVALHSLLGFSSAFFGPLAQGSLLDALGGAALIRSWVIAFAVMGGVGLLGPLALAWGRSTPLAERGACE